VKLFIDSADIDEIEEVLSYGILDGVTTNPSLIKKAAEKHNVKDMEKYIEKILKVCKGKPVSLEVIGTDYEEMVTEGRRLYKRFNPVAKNVYVKIPVNPCMDMMCDKSNDGIKAIKALSSEGIPINCTLIFTPEQALFAAKAGASFVSPFAGRVDDFLRDTAKIKFDKSDYYPAEGMKKKSTILEDDGVVSGVDLVAQCVELFKVHNIQTEVLAASIRNNRQFRECALVGADIATVPFNVIGELLQHYKTMEGMQKFTADIIPEYAKVVGLKTKK